MVSQFLDKKPWSTFHSDGLEVRKQFKVIVNLLGDPKILKNWKMHFFRVMNSQFDFITATIKYDPSMCLFVSLFHCLIYATPEELMSDTFLLLIFPTFTYCCHTTPFPSYCTNTFSGPSQVESIIAIKCNLVGISCVTSHLSAIHWCTDRTTVFRWKLQDVKQLKMVQLVSQVGFNENTKFKKCENWSIMHSVYYITLAKCFRATPHCISLTFPHGGTFQIKSFVASKGQRIRKRS